MKKIWCFYPERPHHLAKPPGYSKFNMNRNILRLLENSSSILQLYLKINYFQDMIFLFACWYLERKILDTYRNTVEMFQQKENCVNDYIQTKTNVERQIVNDSLQKKNFWKKIVNDYLQIKASFWKTNR